MMSERITKLFPEADAIIGVATAGIAMGALIADEMDLSYAYCRPKPKEHGLQRQLEGQMDKKAKIVVIEDLISTGGSSLKVVEYLRNEGYDVLGMAAIFTYGFDLADQNFKNADCKYFTLGNYASLINEALLENYIKQEDLEALNAWREDPENWGN